MDGSCKDDAEAGQDYNGALGQGESKVTAVHDGTSAKTCSTGLSITADVESPYREVTLRITQVTLAMLLVAWTASTVAGQQARRHFTTTARPAPESDRHALQIRGESSHRHETSCQPNRAALLTRAAGEFSHRHEASCQPNRARLLTRAVNEAGPAAIRSPDMRATIAKLRRELTRQEKKEAAQMFRLEANYRKHQELAARKEQRRALNLALAQRHADD